MKKFYVTQTDTFSIYAESLEEAQTIWRSNQVDGYHGEEIEFVDGSADFYDLEEGN